MIGAGNNAAANGDRWNTPPPASLHCLGWGEGYLTSYRFLRGGAGVGCLVRLAGAKVWSAKTSTRLKFQNRFQHSAGNVNLIQLRRINHAGCQWLNHQLPWLAGRSKLAVAMGKAHSRWDGLNCFLDFGHIETCKLHGVGPYTYFRDFHTCMVEGHTVNHRDEQLPWNWKPVYAPAKW